MSSDQIKDPVELNKIYAKRFDPMVAYRNRVWVILTRNFFQKFVPKSASVLDLGAGYGEFINNIDATNKYAMDLNPELAARVEANVRVLLQDCSQRWALEDGVLDVVFTSNFFEHLPDKGTLKKTFVEAHRCLKDDGVLIALGPNIRYLSGAYWDFWDHFLCLTEKSMAEGLQNNGFKIDHVYGKFLPYTMVGGFEVPAFLIRLYLKIPVLWLIFGRQFLVIARKSKV